MNKYQARRTWSELCQRVFASRAEAMRGEELTLMERAGDIFGLEFQPRWVLSTKPKITISADFRYTNAEGETTVEDVKGAGVTRDTRTKLAWLYEKYKVRVRLIQRDGDGWKAL